MIVCTIHSIKNREISSLFTWYQSHGRLRVGFCRVLNFSNPSSSWASYQSHYLHSRTLQNTLPPSESTSSTALGLLLPSTCNQQCSNRPISYGSYLHNTSPTIIQGFALLAILIHFIIFSLIIISLRPNLPFFHLVFWVSS